MVMVMLITYFYNEQNAFGLKRHCSRVFAVLHLNYIEIVSSLNQDDQTLWNPIDR